MAPKAVVAPPSEVFGNKTVEITGVEGQWAAQVNGTYKVLTQGKNNFPCYQNSESKVLLMRDKDEALWKVCQKPASSHGFICVADDVDRPWLSSKAWCIVTGEEANRKEVATPKIRVTLKRDVLVISGRAGFQSRLNGVFVETDYDYFKWPAYKDVDGHKFLFKEPHGMSGVNGVTVDLGWWIISNRLGKPLRRRPAIIFAHCEDPADRPFLVNRAWYVHPWGGNDGIPDGDIEVFVRDPPGSGPAPYMICKSRQQPCCNGGYALVAGQELAGMPVYFHAGETGRNHHDMYLYFDGLCWMMHPKLGTPRIDAIIQSNHRASKRAPDESAWSQAKLHSVKTTKDYTEWRDSRVQPYNDVDFPPDTDSLGELHGMRAADLVWSRAPDCLDGHVVLFDTITPSDILQGALGDCWLMASCAAVAEFPGWMEDCFVTKKVTNDGKYVLRLWDLNTQDWQQVIVSDMIPCHERQPWESHPTPVFAQTDSAELWTLLIEKAFAKLAGSYANLKGGRPGLALQAFTGAKEVWVYSRREDKAWHKMLLEGPKGVPRDFKGASASDIPGEKPLTDFEMSKLVVDLDASNHLMCTIIDNASEEKRDDGLVAGHVYSLIQAKHFPTDTLVQLRNPWGNDMEWKGKWADADVETWLANQEIAHECQSPEWFQSIKDHDHEHTGDGLFWMDFEHYAEIYNQIIVCPVDMVKDRKETTN